MRKKKIIPGIPAQGVRERPTENIREKKLSKK